MAMALRSGNGSGAIVEMNTTPLIDVLLVLLVMLIVTIPMQTHAVKLDTGPHDPASPVMPPVVELAVAFDGSVTWNGTPVTDRATLNTYFAMEARKPEGEQAEIHLRADRLAEYGAVATILADAQRLGVHKIGFTGNDQYME